MYFVIMNLFLIDKQLNSNAQGLYQS